MTNFLWYHRSITISVQDITELTSHVKNVQNVENDKHNQIHTLKVKKNQIEH